MNWKLLLTTLLLLCIGACSNLPSKKPQAGKGSKSSATRPAEPAKQGRYDLDYDAPPDARDIPSDVAQTPDAVPREEPRSRSGNPDYYTVFGRTYVVQKQADHGDTESGKASWYAKKFHGRKTASGEKYDMFAMSAAHKTLPLPSYVRVTRTDNGKSCVVRVNDRGPFHRGRIIDLSYAAAARLDMIHAGEAEVEIEVIQADEQVETQIASATPPPWQPGYWAIGRYDDEIEAAVLREDLREAGLQAEVKDFLDGGRALLRVVVGPYRDETSSRSALEKIRDRGLDPAWLVN